jgi:hypothetical protein
MGSSGWKSNKCAFYMPAGISKIRPVLVAGWAEQKKRPAVSWFDNIEISRLNDRFFTDLLETPEAPALSFKQLSPEKYEVSVSGATKPFLLVFGENFDTLWTARVEGGKSLDPVRLYSTVNGFLVDRKGSYKLTVEYAAQGWFVRGLFVSLAVMLLCALYLCFVIVRRKWWGPCRNR